MAITINVSDQLWKSTNTLFTINQINEYSQTISSFGGYDVCSFTFSATSNQIDDWLENGLGRDINTVNETGTVWNGAVNTITIQSTEKTLSIGPLFDIANKLHLAYVPIFQNSAGQNIFGAKTYLTALEDTDSQTRYGVMERVLINSSTTDSEATQRQNTQLANLKNPRTSQSQSTLSRTGNLISLTCIGYHNYLNYPYSDTTIGTQDLSSKIVNILASEPNTIFSSDTSKITENTTAVTANGNKANGLSLIKSLTTSGDSNYARYIFGIYNNRQAEYKLAPTVIEYQQAGSSNNSIIKDVNGSPVKPENVLAGKWIRYSDLLIGKNQPADIRQSKNSVFVEKVTFISPQTLVIYGNGKSNDGAFQTLQLRGATV
jgi:hypothetical protein